jgi:hypothetical protein
MPLSLYPLPLNLPALGAEIEEGSQQNQSGEEEKDQEVQEASLKGAGDVPAGLQVEIHNSWNND